MDITYLGHSAFRIKTRLSSIVTDPYDSEMVGIKFPKVTADIVTISHNHDDHNAASSVDEVKKIVSGPGEYEIAGVSIIGMPTFHDGEKGATRGRNTIYVFEVDDFRLVHLGDLGHKLPDALLEELGTVDILMIPVGGVYTVGPTEASEIVRVIEPTITIPMHYFLKDLNQSSFGTLSPVDDFLRNIGLPVENLEKLSLKKTELTEEKKVVVLEKK